MMIPNNNRLQVKSKFRSLVLLPVFLVFLLAAFFYLIIRAALDEHSLPVLLVYAIINIVMVFIAAWVVLGELRTKAVSVVLYDDIISSYGFLGLGPYRQFKSEELEEFTTSILSSSGGDYEYLYLMKGHVKVIKLSEFYHKNYAEIKRYIAGRVKYRGVIPFSLSDEFREIFQ